MTEIKAPQPAPATGRRPVIFLDFDGVLNSMASVLATGRGGSVCPDTMSVGLMARLVREADANVVVSSAWRIGASIEDLQGTLTRWGGVDIANRLIGKTPSHGECRGAEIAQWLAEHPNDHDERWVIVDDDGDMLDGQRSRFVQTLFRDGFGVREYVRAIQIIAPQHKDATSLAYYADDTSAERHERQRLQWEGEPA